MSATNSERELMSAFPPAVREMTGMLKAFLIWNALNTAAWIALAFWRGTP